MKKLKILAFIIGLIMIVFGFLGFASFFATTTNEDGVMVSASPIHDVNGIAVDSKGQIYIGDVESGSIQAFSKTGQFIFGNTFPGGAGWFAFGIDNNDVIHIVTARTNSYFQYYNGKLIDSELINYSRQQQLIKEYDMQNNNQYLIKCKEYLMSSSNQITILDHSSNTEEKIILNTPSWPLSILTYWLIGAGGLGLWFWSFAWKMIKSYSKFSFKK
jgi:hypothetical protein